MDSRWAMCCAEDISDGIDHAPGAIAGLYRGENTGKRLIKIR
jgi:NADPH-dependent curcumin reductase CurA